RQDCLELAVAALLGRAAGALTLDDEELGLTGVALLAVGELARQRRELERTFALHHLARLACRLSRARREDRFLDDCPRLARMLLEELGELFVYHRRDDARHFAGDELVFGLVIELGIGMLDGDDGGKAFA